MWYFEACYLVMQKCYKSFVKTDTKKAPKIVPKKYWGGSE